MALAPNRPQIEEGLADMVTEPWLVRTPILSERYRKQRPLTGLPAAVRGFLSFIIRITPLAQHTTINTLSYLSGDNVEETDSDSLVLSI